MRSAYLRSFLTRAVERGRGSFARNSAENVTKVVVRLVALAVATLAVLLTATWHAGRGSGELEGQKLSAQINLLNRQVASTQLDLELQQKKTMELERALNGAGRSAALTTQTQIRQQLLQAQAEVNQYKSILDRQHQIEGGNAQVIAILAKRGAHLFPMRGLESAAEANVYALVIENEQVLLIASKLPKLAEGRQFQLWIMRKQEPKVVSAGVFSADSDNRALMNFEDTGVLADLALLQVTEEPQGGSEEPTGAKVLECGIVDKTE